MTWSMCLLTGEANSSAKELRPALNWKGLNVTNDEEIGSECRHHWIIESPNGPTSQGVCKLCGERGEFRNSMPVSGWDREGAKNRSRQARG